MLKKILSVLCLCLMCFAGTALADVPDPSGRPRPRPYPVQQSEFRVISTRSYAVSLDNDEKPAVEVTYAAPRHAVLEYTVISGGGDVFNSGTDSCETGQSTVKVYFPKVLDGWMAFELRLVCRLNVRETKYGLKHSDKDLYSDREVLNYIVQAKDGVCMAERK